MTVIKSHFKSFVTEQYYLLKKSSNEIKDSFHGTLNSTRTYRITKTENKVKHSIIYSPINQLMSY